MMTGVTTYSKTFLLTLCVTRRNPSSGRAIQSVGLNSGVSSRVGFDSTRYFSVVGQLSLSSGRWPVCPPTYFFKRTLS